MKPFLRTQHNYDMEIESEVSGLRCQDPTLTQQHFADEVNINTIVERFGITGQLPTSVRMPTYEDYSEIVDFQTAMNAIALAREAFDQMPANVRARFNNDPAQFVDFCSNEANRDEAKKLGLLKPEEMAAVAANLAIPPNPPPGSPAAPATGPGPWPTVAPGAPA